MSDQSKANLPPILVVDDDEMSLRLMRFILARAGFDVTTALNGQEALDICHTQPVTLIVLDTMMPVMGGLEMLRVLYSDPAMRHIPVIIATGEGYWFMAEAYDLRAKDYLVLPCQPDELVARVQRVLSDTTA